MNNHFAAENCTESLVAQVADEFLARLRAGENPSAQAYAERYPHLAAVLPQILESLRVLEQIDGDALEGESATGDNRLLAAERCLGDFRLIREVGRGGMGVVYEAEQVSLGRRVALKVLPFAALLDERQLTRFKNEARAAGALHHTNIVPVHFVGCERGVHFYAMQFIDGQSLAQVILALRAQTRMRENRRHFTLDDALPAIPPSLDATTAFREPRPNEAQASEPQRNDAQIPSPECPRPEPRVPRPPPSDTVRADYLTTILTEQRTNPAAHFRTIARLGIQAAEALEHAHQHGVIHRDIKPANLMLDATGNLWITDFGLARLEADAGMTMTGDVLGTLRYMSPEQTLGQRGLVDHRSDVYSLGVTLYELVACEPPFAAEDRAKLLHQIAHDEPPRLRRRDRTIPAELETIVHKALEKNPSDRYATAEALADDLRQFVEGKPIHARPWSLAKRATRWVHRHQSVAWATAVTLLVSAFAVAGSIGWVVRDRAARQTEAEATADSALDEVERLLARAGWPQALAALERAEVLLAGYSTSSLTARAQQLRKDAEIAQRLEEIRHSPATETAWAKGYLYDPESDRKYSDAFREYGIDVQALSPSDAAERIKLSRVRLELTTALDFWAGWRRRYAADDTAWKPLVEIARAADPDPWRNSLRDALETPLPRRKAALIELAASADATSMPPATVILLCARLLNDGAPEQAVQLLRTAHRRHLNDYRITYLLARAVHESDPPQLDEAIRYYTAALAIRPQSKLAHNALGNALASKELLDEAIFCYEEAIRLFPSDPNPHYNLGLAFEKKRLRTEAIACFREAIRLKPDFAQPHAVLGALLHKKGLLDEALASHREAIRLGSDDWETRNNLGVTLCAMGRLDEAIATFKEAIRLQPDVADLHCELGNALGVKGLADEAVASFREAIRLKPDYADAHTGLGITFGKKGMLDEAVSSYRKAIECDPGGSRQAYYNLGNSLRGMGRRDDAIAIYRQAVRVHPNDGGLHHFLGISLREAGAVDEAIVSAKESVRLAPDHEDAQAALGRALLQKGDLESAIESLEKSIQLSAGGAVKHGAYERLAEALHRKGGSDAIVAYYEKALRERPDSAGVHLGLAAAAFHERGDPDRARQLLRRVRRETLEDPEVLIVYSALLLILGDRQQYEAVRREMAAKLSAIDKESRLGAAIKLCCLAPVDEPLAKQLVALVEKEGFESRTTKGLVHYRAGNWQQAKEIFLAGQRQVPESINYHLGLALTCHRLNEPDEARGWFERGERALRAQIGSHEFRIKHYDLILSQFLHREAAELLGVKIEAAAQAVAPKTE